MESITHWVKENKLRAIGLFWASSVAGSLAYQWTRPIPTQLKIIHSRVYAQALTLAALGLTAAADVYEHRIQTSRELSEYKTRLHELESKFGHDSRQYHEAEEQIEHKFGKENVA